MSISFYEADGNELGIFFPERLQQANAMQMKKSDEYANADSELLEF